MRRDAEIRYASNMLTAKQFGLLRIGTNLTGTVNVHRHYMHV